MKTIDLAGRGVNLGSLTGSSQIVTEPQAGLQAGGTLANQSQGMSTGAKAAVAVVIVAAVGGGAYAWSRSKRRKSNRR